MDPLMFGMLAASVIGAWWTLFITIPRCAAARYRSRLWKLRDRAIDHLLSGELESTPAARDFIDQVEGRIRFAHDLTLFRGAAIMLGVRFVGLPDQPFVPPAPRASDRKIIHEMQHQVLHADGRHLLFGSPSGWVATVVLFVAATVRALYLRAVSHRRRGFRDVGVETAERFVERTYGDSEHPDVLVALQKLRPSSAPVSAFC